MYRLIAEAIKETLEGTGGQIVLILGLRQTGKTTLAKTACGRSGYRLFNFDLASDREEFSSHDRHSLRQFYDRYGRSVILIDEIQKLPEATSTVKYLFDEYRMRFLLTGSSELKIRKNVGDSLVGRVRTFRLFPLSLKEIQVQSGIIQPQDKVDFESAQDLLGTYLVYGSLPAVQNLPAERYASFLTEFVGDLLSKDVLEVAHLRRSTKIFALSKYLAQQIGSLVNVNKLANLAEVSRQTVYSLLDVLEQLNLIIRAYPVSTNQRQAISEKFKVYFTDNGLRNALFGNFEPLGVRLDTGQLLENAVYVGIYRSLLYQGLPFTMGFYRSAAGSEVDIVVHQGQVERLYEVKYSGKNRSTSGVQYITLSNAWEYL